MNTKPILVLEVNEIPWRLVDELKEDPRFPNLKLFFSKAKTYTTVTVDSGELSPWITWPSLHRGMNAEKHGIRFLGQNPTTFRGIPIWDEFRSQGLSIGICGSLQSWPPKNPGPKGFYIPDTFAADATCIPSYVEPFQRFNLKQTSANKRVVSKNSLFSIETIKLLFSLKKNGVRMRTLVLLARQLIGEVFNSKQISRRPVFQAILFWDVFRNLFKEENPPAFSTFFTNHVASIMHRYWHETFPEDFEESISQNRDATNSTMLFAVQVLENILTEALSFQQKNPQLKLVFATSMGQGPAVWSRFEGFSTFIHDVKSLINQCTGEEIESQSLLAMVPQIVADIKDDAQRARARHSLENATTHSGEKLFFTEEISTRLSISMRTPFTKDIHAGGFFSLNSGIKKWISWNEAGIRVEKVEPGTGYHIPEGVLAVISAGTEPSDARTRIPADEVKTLLMELAGLDKTYKEKSPEQTFSQSTRHEL